MTPQRQAILRVIEEAQHHLTPLEVIERARARLPGVTDATIYRTLSFLSAQGLILEAHVGSGQLVYESAAHAHHHLICRACGQSHQIDHTVLQALYQELERSSGFVIDSFHVTFFGLCPTCQDATVSAAPPKSE
jgi:Fe2+ or Zn2+ uptake regulation protein